MKRKIRLLLIFIFVFIFLIQNSVSASSEYLTIDELPLGSIVYDSSWTWEHRTGDSYTETGTIKPIEWLVVAKDHTGYPSNSVTVISNELIGKQIFDNSTNRGNRNGSSHWGNSGNYNAAVGLRPWLNNTFYNSFGDKFKSLVLNTTVPNKDYTGFYYTTTDKVFIPSNTELGVAISEGSDINPYDIGYSWGYFNPTTYTTNKADLSKVAKLEGISLCYRTRSPWTVYMNYRGTSGKNFANNIIAEDGKAYGGWSAYLGNAGVRPVLNLKSNIVVKSVGSNKYEITYNSPPTLTVTHPLPNLRTGDQNNILISGNIRDLDIGQNIIIKYSIGNTTNQNVILTQPTSLVSNGQSQMFQGYIGLNGLRSGNNTLKLWAEDNEGAKSSVIEIPIIVFNTLEGILRSLESYIYKAGEPQFLVINSNTTIKQSIRNDELITEIRKELKNKNIKLYFIGKAESQYYIDISLLGN